MNWFSYVFIGLLTVALFLIIAVSIKGIIKDAKKYKANKIKQNSPQDGEQS